MVHGAQHGRCQVWDGGEEVGRFLGTSEVALNEQKLKEEVRRERQGWRPLA